MLTLTDLKDIGMRKFEFVKRPQFLSTASGKIKVLTKYSLRPLICFSLDKKP